jgi:hypothetical protein
MTPTENNKSSRELTWTLTDLRLWWDSPARRRWLRALRLTQQRDLTNFGDVS